MKSRSVRTPREKTHRRQLRQRKALITTRAVLTLIALSVAVAIAVRLYVGDPLAAECAGGDCDDLARLWPTVAGFFLLLLSVIGTGALTGALISFFKRRNSPAVSPWQQMDQHQGKDTPQDTRDT